MTIVAGADERHSHLPATARRSGRAHKDKMVVYDEFVDRALVREPRGETLVYWN